MKTSAYLRLAGIAMASVLLVACSDDKNTDTPPVNENEMTTEKYGLVAMAIQEMVDLGNISAGGRLIISDRTTMGHQTESFMAGDESLEAMTALDSIFPYDFLSWSLEESDLAFARYYQANTQPVDIRLDGLESLNREKTLIMHEQFMEYLAEDEWAGWDQFYAENSDAAGYVRIANPVVSKDSGFALVHVDFICGPFCGIGYFALFRFENGTWVFKDWYADWVS